LTATYTSFDLDEDDYEEALDVTGDTVIEQNQTWYDQAGEVVATATYQRLPDDTTTTGALTAANSYATAAVAWHDGIGRVVATAEYGREDVDSGLTHYFFDDTTGELIDEDENGIPDIAEDTPPEPYPQDQNSQAGIDFQLSLTEYDSAGRAYRTIDNLGRINETQYDDAGRTIRTIQNYDDGDVDETDTDQDVTVDYQYDSGGRLVTMTAYNPKGTGNGVQDQATKYLYESAINASWQTVVVYPDSEDELEQDEDTGVWSFTDDNGDHVSTAYDRLGRTTSMTDQRGVEHSYVYDSAGRLAHDRVTDLGESGVVDEPRPAAAAPARSARSPPGPSSDGPCPPSSVCTAAETSAVSWHPACQAIRATQEGRFPLHRPAAVSTTTKSGLTSNSARKPAENRSDFYRSAQPRLRGSPILFP
jgi:YD repeat-containing protein